MIYIKHEGFPMKWGFNFYPLKSKHIGFKFYLGGGKSWQIRYSKEVGLLWIGKKSFKLRKNPHD